MSHATAEISEFTSLSDMRVTELVVLAQDGDREAYGELFSRYHQSMFALALRKMGNWNEAEELTQDVFVQGMEKIGQLRSPERFGGWLRAIAVRMAINRINRKSNSRTTAYDHPENLDEADVERETAVDIMITAERADIVRAGLDQLTELDRETLLAFYVRKLSIKQMMEEFDAPDGTIKRRLHVARNRLGREVEELINGDQQLKLHPDDLTHVEPLEHLDHEDAFPAGRPGHQGTGPLFRQPA